jgi:hypothetical protein
MVVIIMFICLDCGCVFDEPKHWIETHGLDSPPYEEWDGCPFCGGTYAETYKCDNCGDWINGEYVKLKNGDNFCENCYEIREIGE